MVDPNRLPPPHHPLEEDSGGALASRLIRALTGGSGAEKATRPDSGELGDSADAIDALARLVADRLAVRSTEAPAAPFAASSLATHDAVAPRSGSGRGDVGHVSAPIAVHRETIRWNCDAPP